MSNLESFSLIPRLLAFFLRRWCRSVWSKHSHAGRLRSANAISMPNISQSHKDIVLARQSC